VNGIFHNENISPEIRALRGYRVTVPAIVIRTTTRNWIAQTALDISADPTLLTRGV